MCVGIWIHFCINSASAIINCRFVVPLFGSLFEIKYKHVRLQRAFWNPVDRQHKLLSCIKSRSVAYTLRTIPFPLRLSICLLPQFVLFPIRSLSLINTPCLQPHSSHSASLRPQYSQGNLTSYNWIFRVLLLDPHLKSLTLLQINHKPTFSSHTHTCIQPRCVHNRCSCLAKWNETK